MLNKLREPINGLTHLAAAIAAAMGLIIYLYNLGSTLPSKNMTIVFAIILYSFSLILMFSASASYHLLKATPQVIQRLRKLDHSSIYLLIAGTYTPICLHFFSGFWRIGLLSTVWTLAILGVLVTVFYINKPRWVTAAIYMVMGWLCVLGLGQMLENMPFAAFLWLLTGGLFYSIGAAIYATKKPDFFPGVFGFHELWHIFVILGAFSHFILIFKYIAIL